jgi:hypothetical protein
MTKKSCVLLILFYVLTPITYLYFNNEKIDTWGATFFKFSLIPAFILFFNETVVKDINRMALGYSVRKLPIHFCAAHSVLQIILIVGVFYFNEKNSFVSLVLLVLFNLSIAHLVATKDIFMDVRRDYMGMLDELREIKGFLTWEEACKKSTCGMASLDIYIKNSEPGEEDFGEIEATINAHGTTNFKNRPSTDVISDKNLSDIVKKVAKWKPIQPKDENESSYLLRHLTKETHDIRKDRPTDS